MNGIAAASNPEATLDYARIEKTIAYLHAHFLEQPDLTTIARAAHLSEFHFQRLFTRWAGISPKRFLQFLTIEHAKRQLAESRAVLDVALDSGLSSPGRLHDLFVSIEALSPGEFKTRGAGVEIQFGFHDTRFGKCLLATTRRGICWLSFINGDKDAALRELKSRWSGAEFFHRPDLTAEIAAKIFPGIPGRKNAPLSVLVMGTNFQVQVWQALLRIPTGTVVSYETIAEWVGEPRATRAIGAAVGRNSIAWLIPCHRVIRKTGLIGGYRWGEPRKQAMLGWEAARVAK